jgi:hypothetical protein
MTVTYGMMIQKLEQMVKKCIAKYTDETTDFKFYSTLYNFKFYTLYI